MPISGGQPENSISFQIQQWFTLRKWTKEESRGEQRHYGFEADYGFGNTRKISYKKFMTLDEQPLWLSMVMIQKNGEGTQFKLNHCYASFPSGAQKDGAVGREYLLGKVSKAIEEFEEYVNYSMMKDDYLKDQAGRASFSNGSSLWGASSKEWVARMKAS